MKRLTPVFTYLLLCTGGVWGQMAEWTNVYSDELHFFASFPGEPKQSKRQIDTAFGKGTEHRWSTESRGIAYEISVTDFADSAVKDRSKELRAFYEAACVEIGGSGRECRGLGGYDMFGELGVFGGFRTPAGSVAFHMFIVGKRWYVAKLEVNESAERATRYERKKFMDEFHFTYVDEKDKKLKLGLPKSESQNQELW